VDAHDRAARITELTLPQLLQGVQAAVAELSEQLETGERAVRLGLSG
jgi:hypothetical protein